MSALLSPEVQAVRSALGTFWAVFAACAVVADQNLLPGVSRLLRSLAVRGKGDDLDGEGGGQPAAGIGGSAGAVVTAEAGNDEKGKGDPDAVPKTTEAEEAQGETSGGKSGGGREGDESGFLARLMTVPHSWFAHFYLVGAACNALLLLHVMNHADALTAGAQASDLRRGLGDRGAVYSATSGALTAALFQVHVMRRLVEAIAVSKYRPGARMHVVLYLGGLAYYIAAPFTLLSPGALQSVLDAGAAGFQALGPATPLVALGRGFIDVTGVQTWAAAAWAATPAPPAGLDVAADLAQRLRENLRAVGGGQSGMGTALFVMGNIHQNRYHRHLAAIRGPGGNAVAAGSPAAAASPHARTYGIPYGGWFDAVSCPHFLAEVMLYAGLALTAGPNAAATLPMLAAVVANLAVAARRNHAWYLKHMPDYPKNRFAMIPRIL
jgi:3-oxo-5-alpha-steroid 4-dehydrogenase 3